jgi:hypothetical protein
MRSAMFANPGRPARYLVRTERAQIGYPDDRHWCYEPRDWHNSGVVGHAEPVYHGREDAETHLYRTGIGEATLNQMFSLAEANPGVPVVLENYVVTVGNKKYESILA